MENFEPKKLLILRILDILEEYTDSENQLSQGEIIALLKVVYGIECERKAVARNVDFLCQAGYDIISSKSGTYLAARKYEVGELRLLIDSVLSSRHICRQHTKELVDKLSSEGGKHFKPFARHVINLDDWQKTESKDFFYNVELLCESIASGKKIELMYNAYGIDKQLHARNNHKQLVNPYQLLLKNGRYYLACNYDRFDNINYLRVDHISDIVITAESVKPLTAVPSYENGINLGKLNNRLPYMFDGEHERIEFLTTADLIDDAIDWFGFDIGLSAIDKTDSNTFDTKVSLIANPKAMRFWILQYGKYVKILSPQSLVDKIKQDMTEVNELYLEEKL